ncbi:FkbM family methyltransferase [Rosistilla oblonga]|uniref:FkbM family methyltransferase n=1 Tax=Rosistilla oblonga TaxID=2527990 RepID=UPI003A9795C7
MQVHDDRDFGKQAKRFLPAPVFRVFTVMFNCLTSLIPFRVKYAIGARFGKRRAPYRFLKPTDTVVQVGSARDILHTGRSRPILLSRMVPAGRVIVIEADKKNSTELKRVISRNGIQNIDVVECGVWDSKSTLTFLSSDRHPAANLLVEAKEIRDDQSEQRGYTKHLVEVDTIDNILEENGATHPTLVSITINGAELTAVRGVVRTIDRCAPYICLASTGPGFEEAMAELGYKYIARDDRGYCYERNESVGINSSVDSSGKHAA